MPTPTFTSPPTAPSRDDASATFISRANAFLAWLVSFVPQLETLVDWIVDALATITSLGGQATTENGIDLRDLLARLWIKRWFIVGAVLGVSIAYSLPVKYQAQVVALPPQSSFASFLPIAM